MPDSADCRAELGASPPARPASGIMRVLSARRPLLDHAFPATTPRRRALWALAAAVAAAIALVLPREPEVAPSPPSLADSPAARGSITGHPLPLPPFSLPTRLGPSMPRVS